MEENTTSQQIPSQQASPEPETQVQEQPKKGRRFSFLSKRSNADRPSAGTDAEPTPPPVREELPTHNPIYLGLAKMAPLALIVLVAACTWMPLIVGDISCPAEVRNMACIKAAAAAPFLPNADGTAMLPVFAWLANAALHLHLPENIVTPLLTSACGAFAVVSVWALSIFAGYSLAASFAAGLLFLCLPLTVACANFIGATALATALSVLAIAVIGKAWTKTSSVSGMVLGNILAAAAALSGGIYYALVPLLSSIAFSAWRFQRGQRRGRDAVIGFGTALVILAVWGAGAIATVKGVPTATVAASLVAVGKTGLGLKTLWVALMVAVPCLLLLPCVSWVRVVREARADVMASRTTGITPLLWIALGLSIVLLPISAHAGDALLGSAVLAALCGRPLMKLHRGQMRVYFLLCCFIFIGIAFLWVCATMPSTMSQAVLAKLPESLAAKATIFQGLGIAYIIGFTILPVFCAAAIMHVVWRSSSAAAPLLISTLMVVFFCQPTGILLAPKVAAIPAFQLTAAKAPFALFGAKAEAPKEETLKDQTSQEAPAATPAPEAAQPAAPEATKTESPKEEAPGSDASKDSAMSELDARVAATAKEAEETAKPVEAMSAKEDANPAEEAPKAEESKAENVKEAPKAEAAEEKPALSEPAPIEEKAPENADADVKPAPVETGESR